MEEALRSILTSASGVTTLVSTRIYWGLAPQSVADKSYVQLNRISGRRDYHMASTSGLVESRIQVDCWAEDYSGAKSLARAVIIAVSGYKGTVSGIEFQGVFVESERDLNEGDSGEVNRLYRVAIDLIIWHSE